MVIDRNDQEAGAMLRALREARGVSLTQMAALTHYHKSYLGFLETGRRRITPEIVEAYERVLELEPKTSEVTFMRRRAVLAALTAGVVTSPAHLSERIRQTFVSALDESAAIDDWVETVEDYGRRFMNSNMELLRPELAGDLLRLRSVLNGPHFSGAAARLATIFGMTVASAGDTHGAIRWYRTAVALADDSGDPATRVWVRGRGALTMGYEGADHAKIVKMATEAVSVAGKPSTGLLEAHIALAQAHAARGDKHEALRALNLALDTFPAVEAAGQPTIFKMPAWRMAMSASLVYCRLGDSQAAVNAQELSTKLRPPGLIRFESHIKLHQAILAHDIPHARSVVEAMPAGHVSAPVRFLAMEAGVDVSNLHA